MNIASFIRRVFRQAGFHRPTYNVTFDGRRWVVETPTGELEGHRTQQEAVEGSKARAVKERANVIWHDRQGKEQGHVRFGL